MKVRVVNATSRVGELVLRAGTAEVSTERHRAFEELVRLFQDRAFALAFAVLREPADAEDAAQRAFITAWQKLGQLEKPDAFPGWLRRVVLSECSRVRRGRRRASVSTDDAVTLKDSAADPLHLIERAEKHNRLSAAIRRLPGDERVVITLFYMSERSQKEIGAFLGLPVTTVAKRLYSARIRLKAMVTDPKNDLSPIRPSRGTAFEQKVREGLFDDYVGTYRFDERPDLPVTIRREGSHLVSESAGQTNYLFAKGGSTRRLRAREFDGSGEFVRDAKGRVTGFVYREFGREMGTATKIA
jgi:RNA polymerase sigma factor (sigma-70 family)